METQTVTTEPSIAELRGLLSGSEPAPAPAEAKPATSEPAPEPAAEENHEAATETAETKPEPTEPADEPLPPGVQKRIAKEVAREAEYQRQIDEAVSRRKAKEAELAKLAEDRGTAPVNKPESSTDKPKKPAFAEPGHETETWEQYEKRLDAFDEARVAWIKAEAVREVEQRTAAERAQAQAKERWDAAVKEHGPEFPVLMEKATAIAPEGLQQAISSMEHWSKVAVHLAKNEPQLRELAETFKQNPVKAIATLGRIEAAITAAKEPKPATKPLPEPIPKGGGTASASGMTLQDTLEKGSFRQFKATVSKLRG